MRFGTGLAISENGTDLMIGAPRFTGTLGDQGAVYHYIAKSSTHVADGSTTEFTAGFDIDHSYHVGVFVDNTDYHLVNGDSSTTPNFTTDGTSNIITFGVAPASGSSIVIQQYVLQDTITSVIP